MEYRIKFKPSGHCVDAPAAQSILDSALGQGITVNHSCKQGNCGSCNARILSGTVKNINGELIEHGDILACNSFPMSNLILEIECLGELKDINVQNLPCKVSKIKFLKNRYFILTLRIPPNNVFKFLPGQYIDLTINGITRSYSIASLLNNKSEFDLHIRYVENGKMSQILKNICSDQLMRLEGPKGTFFIRNSEAPIIFLASGTGYAPIKTMMDDLIRNQSQRLIHIYWRMQKPEFFYLDYPVELVLNDSNIKFIPFVASNNCNWDGRKGDIDTILMEDFNGLADFHVYVCGSQNFINKSKEICIELGLNLNHFYFDAFTISGS